MLEIPCRLESCLHHQAYSNIRIFPRAELRFFDMLLLQKPLQTQLDSSHRSSVASK